MYNEIAEERLILLLKEDDRAAFDEIYSRYWEPLSIAAVKITGSFDDACDIVQDVFVKIWKNRRELTIIYLKGYLFRSVRNGCIKHIQQSSRTAEFLQSFSIFYNNMQAQSANLPEARELQAILEAAVSALPHKMQEVYMLSRNQNLSYKEIATRLNIAETTVKKQVSNALKHIRTEVKRAQVLLVFLILLSL